MPRIDDYIASRNISVSALAEKAVTDIAFRSGFLTDKDNAFIVPFLDRTYRVNFPSFSFEDRNTPEKDVPIQEQVLILHYMVGSKAQALFDRWVSYREIPGASFYYSAFVKRAVEPLKKAFGADITGLEKATVKLGGVKIKEGDIAYELTPFPKVPMRLIFWAGDDEFPAEANILFDGGIGTILSPEDVAWLAGMVAYRLIACSR